MRDQSHTQEKKERVYCAIDLKSFYASVEASSRRLDPLSVCLVVADASRTDKTICLAVSPPLKSFGVPARGRLFEVKQRVMEVNADRRLAYGKPLTGKTSDINELRNDPSLALDFVIATPRMNEYMRISSEIYKTYLDFVSPEDIHVYSIDEVFIDLTGYLSTYGCSAHELVKRMVKKVFLNTGITATAGIGTNLYLAKVAMDIMAKHEEADEDGVRIAYLDELTYRKSLWGHENLRDFWRVGPGYINRLRKLGLYTMGDIARASLNYEDKLYQEFGINAELLIDHAWGFESATIKDIKAYKPRMNCISSGQVLPCPYSEEKARLVVKEMTESLALDLVDKGLYCNQFGVALSYHSVQSENYKGDIKKDWYGKLAPKPTHGGVNFDHFTHSRSLLLSAANRIFDAIMVKGLFVRAIHVSANNLVDGEGRENLSPDYEQLSLFDEEEKQKVSEEEEEKEEEELQQAILSIQRKYGKNSILKGNDLVEGATKKERNTQVGGHKG